MAEVDLKIYISRAVELETAIYTQKKLMEEHERILQKRRPKAPVMKQIKEPVEPQPPELFTQESKGKSIFLIVCLFIISFCSMVLGPVGIIFGIAVFAFACFCIRTDKEERQTTEELNQQRIEEYEKQRKQYSLKKEKYNRDIIAAEKEYSVACNNYKAEASAYDTNSSLLMTKHNEALLSLQNALHELYTQNIVYPKYRNIVAITTISEYLMSGRCSALEGSEGAYNLFESEIRQNIVINQLSVIVSNLEQIRNNQFMLYQELDKANSTIDSILHEIKAVNQNTKLTAYFAGVTALIEATPKVYIGRSIIF